jgi:linoleoyl-CoA desaturase
LVSAGDDTNRTVAFDGHDPFRAELRRRVDAFFRSTGRRERDCWQMYLKTGILLGALAACYLLLVFVARSSWLALPLAVLLGLAAAGVGFNVQHDGGHQAYSSRRWVNRLMAMTLDLVGGSSYVWRRKHAILHHTYVNIAGHDTDIDLGPLARLAPDQPRRSFHRWQHLYLWPLYGMLAIKWHLVTDFRNVITGRIGGREFPRPRGLQLAVFLSGKALFLTLAFGIPLLRHSPWTVLAYYGLVALVLGITLSVTFQLAHCVEEAEFPTPRPDTGRVGTSWAIHQVETTVNFARRSGPLAWFLGGLNFQIEHHLFPRICHVNYPAMSAVVEATCREFSVRYAEHASLRSGLASHFKWLRRMGRPAPESGAASSEGTGIRASAVGSLPGGPVDVSRAG